MDSAQKLVDTLNEAIQRAGGEAARIWPSMVAQKGVGAAMGVWGFGITAAVFLLAAAVFVTVGVRHVPASHSDDTAAACFFVGAILTVLGLGAMLLAASNVPAYFYPEPALVRELMGR